MAYVDDVERLGKAVEEQEISMASAVQTLMETAEGLGLSIRPKPPGVEDNLRNWKAYRSSMEQGAAHARAKLEEWK